MLSFFEDVSNWWMDNIIRLEPSTKAIVLPLMMAIAFYCWYLGLKKTKKDMKGMKGFPWHWYIIGALVFGLALWIIAGS